MLQKNVICGIIKKQLICEINSVVECFLDVEKAMGSTPLSRTSKPKRGNSALVFIFLLDLV